MRSIIILSFLITLFACSTEKKSKIDSNENLISKSETELKKQLSSDQNLKTKDSVNKPNSVFNSEKLPMQIDSKTGKILYSVRTNFSSNTEKDKFEIKRILKDKTDSTTFKIFNSNRKIIYDITFGTWEIINKQTDSLGNIDFDINDVELAYLKFLDDRNFLGLAIEPKEDYDEDYFLISKNDWTVLKNNQPKGFFYKLAEEVLVWICFDKRKNKVIDLRTCC